MPKVEKSAMFIYMKKIAFLLAIVVVAAIAIIYFARVGNNNLSPSESPSETPSSVITTPSASPSPTPKPSARPSPTPTPESYVVPECWLGGTITFEDNVFKTSDAYLNYDKVIDNHDFIKWTITPADGDVSIGPNMFASLPLPSGREIITISFNSGGPKYGEYTLKASVDYPVELPEGGKVLNASCSGETKLIIK